MNDNLTIPANDVLEYAHTLRRLLDIYHIKEAKKVVDSLIEQIEGAK